MGHGYCKYNCGATDCWKPYKPLTDERKFNLKHQKAIKTIQRFAGRGVID